MKDKKAIATHKAIVAKLSPKLKPKFYIRHFPTDEPEERAIENVPDRVLENLIASINADRPATCGKWEAKV
ncbi:hypothetical protein LCGC14_1759420 [marine sediment metagenome]|uniref:Uncharacterized protein n=1 Tax=marine sediment metagenome TaxID=412755 RepID=A0A0F9K159_9ZZZZ